MESPTLTKVRCKFVCEETATRSWPTPSGIKLVYDAKFRPVYSGSPENEAFFEATPSGQLVLSSTKCDLFVAGGEYYIDITQAV